MVTEGLEERSKEMMEVRLFGPRDDQWAVINLGSQWLATTRAVYAEAVKQAIADAISQQSNPSD